MHFILLKSLFYLLNLKINHFEIQDKGSHLNETCLCQKSLVSRCEKLNLVKCIRMVFPCDLNRNHSSSSVVALRSFKFGKWVEILLVLVLL